MSAKGKRASMASKSGSPDKGGLTVKQQREVQRAEKVAAFKREQARRARNRKIGLWAGIGGGIVAVAGIVSIIVVTSMPSAPVVIDGLQTFSNEATHVQGVVDYAQDPPAGGEHSQVWINCGIYDQPVVNENAVHALEHGAVWITYDPALPAADVDALRAAVPSTYVVLSPYPGLDAPVVASAWDAQVRLDSVDDPRLGAFIQEYWKSSSAPEPGAPCTGGIDGDGRIA